MQWYLVSDATTMTFMLIQVMIHLGMLEIPAGNIVERWTMHARDNLPAHMIELENDKAAESSLWYIQSELFFHALEFMKSCRAFEVVGLADLVQLKQELLELNQVKDVSVLSEQCSHPAAQGSNVQGMSAAATDDAISAAKKQKYEAEAPDLKCKMVQRT